MTTEVPVTDLIERELGKMLRGSACPRCRELFGEVHPLSSVVGENESLFCPGCDLEVTVSVNLGAADMNPEARVKIAEAFAEFHPPTPTLPAPSIGRILHYVLSEQDALVILRARTEHFGKDPKPGDVVPLIVVVVAADGSVNGQAILDGKDIFWVRSAKAGDGHGTWRWPPRV